MYFIIINTFTLTYIYHSYLGSPPTVPTSTSGIFRCSTQWPIQLIGLLRQCLGWIPIEIEVQKRVYWCVLLLDTLQGECW